MTGSPLSHVLLNCLHFHRRLYHNAAHIVDLEVHTSGSDCYHLSGWLTPPLVASKHLQ